MRALPFIALPFIALLTFNSCAPGYTKLIHDYYFYEANDWNYEGELSHDKNVLMCKLSCENDAYIKDVIQIQWNQTTIIAKTDIGYFVIKSNPKSNATGLCCCCENMTIGPFKKSEIKAFKKRTNFVARFNKFI